MYYGWGIGPFRLKDLMYDMTNYVAGVDITLCIKVL